MQLSWCPFDLQLKYTFTISNYSRSYTPLVLIQISHQGLTGYGEASLPPYLGESQESIQAFFERVDLSSFREIDIPAIHTYLETLDPHHTAAKAAIDMALHDLLGKSLDEPSYRLLGSDPAAMPATTLTIGIDEPEVLFKKVQETGDFRFLKVKLGSRDDRRIIETIRRVSDKPIYVDANQGWKDGNQALDMICWLQEQGVVLIEQPMPKESPELTARLKEQSPLPLFADESCQRLGDIDALKGVFDGINIKLMKCSGMYEARQMIARARALDMGVMIGCMNESSCAIMAAAALAPQADHCDLDGPWLVSNNPFAAPLLEDGKIVLSDRPGLGVVRL